MKFGICTVTCHFLLLLCMNIFSAITILFTQGVFIYFKYSTFALGGFIGPFMGEFYCQIILWIKQRGDYNCNEYYAIDRKLMIFSYITLSTSAATVPRRLVVANKGFRWREFCRNDGLWLAGTNLRGQTEKEFDLFIWAMTAGKSQKSITIYKDI